MKSVFGNQNIEKYIYGALLFSMDIWHFRETKGNLKNLSLKTCWDCEDIKNKLPIYLKCVHHIPDSQVDKATSVFLRSIRKNYFFAKSTEIFFGKGMWSIFSVNNLAKTVKGWICFDCLILWQLQEILYCNLKLVLNDFC